MEIKSEEELKDAPVYGYGVSIEDLVKQYQDYYSSLEIELEETYLAKRNLADIGIGDFGGIPVFSFYKDLLPPIDFDVALAFTVNVFFRDSLFLNIEVKNQQLKINIISLTGSKFSVCKDDIFSLDDISDQLELDEFQLNWLEDFVYTWLEGYIGLKQQPVVLLRNTAANPTKLRRKDLSNLDDSCLDDLLRYKYLQDEYIERVDNLLDKSDLFTKKGFKRGLKKLCDSASSIEGFSTVIINPINHERSKKTLDLIRMLDYIEENDLKIISKKWEQLNLSLIVSREPIFNYKDHPEKIIRKLANIK